MPIWADEYRNRQEANFKGPRLPALEEKLGEPLRKHISDFFSKYSTMRKLDITGAWKRRVDLVATGSGRSAHDVEFTNPLVQKLKVTEPKNFAAAKLTTMDELISLVEKEPMVIRPVGKLNELAKARAIYPVPLYHSILEAIVYSDLE